MPFIFSHVTLVSSCLFPPLPSGPITHWIHLHRDYHDVFSLWRGLLLWVCQLQCLRGDGSPPPDLQSQPAHQGAARQLEPHGTYGEIMRRRSGLIRYWIQVLGVKCYVDQCEFTCRLYSTQQKGRPRQNWIIGSTVNFSVCCMEDLGQFQTWAPQKMSRELGLEIFWSLLFTFGECRRRLFRVRRVHNSRTISRTIRGVVAPFSHSHIFSHGLTDIFRKFY